jgi:hypothetical protein
VEFGPNSQWFWIAAMRKMPAMVVIESTRPVRNAFLVTSLK